MPGTVAEFSISYDAINEDNTFTSGDWVTGRVLLRLGKEAKLDSLAVKLKGEADVRWTERHGDDDHTYSAHERYFKLKHCVVEKSSGGDSPVVAPGSHVYPFSFQLPQQNMPSSFKGAHGKIVYGLEAKMKRPWKLSRNEKCTITFVSRHTEDMAQLMCPQFGSIDKKMKLFTSGTASLKAETDKKAYVQGEMLRVTTAIENSSSRDLKPKFKLEQKISFIASSSTKNSWGSIFKDSGQPVPSKSQQTMTREFKLPADLTPTIMHCKIIKVEYTLKVYLDVPYASDPEVLFPLVILPVTKHYGPGLTGPFSGMSDFPPAYPAYPPPPGPGIYPSLFPSGVQPQPANPGMPSPSSKQETYPTAPAAGPYPTAPGPYPVPPAPGYYLNPAAPGPYTSPSVPESYLTPNAPGSYPVPSAPESFLTPSAPGVYPTLNAPQFNLNPTEPPPSYAEVFPNPCGPEFSPLSKTADQNKPSK